MFTSQWGHRLDPTGTPILPTPPEPGTDPAHHVAKTATGAGIGTHTYVPPTGERLDRSGFHLIEADQPPADSDPADDDPPPPTVTGQRPPAARPAPTSPAGDTPVDPTRAGPDAASSPERLNA